MDLDGVRYVFEVEHSVMTGKKRLFRNNTVVHEEKSLRKLFSHEMQIASHRLVFGQQGDKFDLRVDNESFSYVYNQLKQSDHFEYEDHGREESRDEAFQKELQDREVRQGSM